ncbi:MAG TPA: FG-GAP repeat protein, partial [Polyangium sp.]|nr:FG-GAP repeat protein [Polyangium sp.]
MTPELRAAFVATEIEPLIGVEQAKLTSSDGAAQDDFGWAIALSGDTALIAARSDDIGGNGDQGAVYVFARNGTMWTEQTKLVASDGAANDYFGSSVALSGDTALIAAPGVDTGPNVDNGAVYVFARNGTTWTEQTKLVASDGNTRDFFGWSVALSDDTALIGASNVSVTGNNGQGSAYVFVRNGTTWTEQTKLIASDGAAGDRFGASVALSVDTALIGAYNTYAGTNIELGSAYVFVRNGATWTEQAELIASDRQKGDSFGRSLALSGDTAVIS